MATDFTMEQIQSHKYPHERKKWHVTFVSVHQHNRYRKTTEEDNTGTNHDVDKNLIVKKLKETVRVVDVTTLMTKEDFDNHIEELSGSLELGKYDVFMFAFLTFVPESSTEAPTDGMIVFEGQQRFDSNEPCSMEYIFEKVKTVEGMHGKPKIFLVQADDPSLLHEKRYTKSAGDAKMIQIKIPQDADRLVISSNIPQQLTANEEEAEKRSSLLVHAFCETLQENARSGVDLLSLTTTVNNKVRTKLNELRERSGDTNIGFDRMNVPLVTSTFTKLLYLED